jgi:ankyrin repeat protein
VNAVVSRLGRANCNDLRKPRRTLLRTAPDLRYRILLDHGNDINYQDPRPGPGYPRQGWTLLDYAARNAQHPSILEYLAARGANLDIVDSAGWTALQLAVDHDFVVATQAGHMPSELPTAEILVGVGADDAIRDKEGRTARDILDKFGFASVFDEVKERVRQGGG